VSSKGGKKPTTQPTSRARVTVGHYWRSRGHSLQDAPCWSWMSRHFIVDVRCLWNSIVPPPLGIEYPRAPFSATTRIDVSVFQVASVSKHRGDTLPKARKIIGDARRTRNLGRILHSAPWSVRELLVFDQYIEYTRTVCGVHYAWLCPGVGGGQGLGWVFDSGVYYLIFVRVFNILRHSSW
jgi:hypothetical protein